jgi:hypothetical protein
MMCNIYCSDKVRVIRRCSEHLDNHFALKCGSGEFNSNGVRIPVASRIPVP